MTIDFEDKAPPSKTIMVVEDSKEDRLLIAKQVQQAWSDDVHLLECSSLREAYKTLKSKPTIDLILLDLNLPDTYGPSSVSDMRKINNKAPIIGMTGFGTQLTVDEAKKNGAADFIFKSEISDYVFIDTIKKHIG